MKVAILLVAAGRFFFATANTITQHIHEAQVATTSMVEDPDKYMESVKVLISQGISSSEHGKNSPDVSYFEQIVTLLQAIPYSVTYFHRRLSSRKDITLRKGVLYTDTYDHTDEHNPMSQRQVTKIYYEDIMSQVFSATDSLVKCLFQTAPKKSIRSTEKVKRVDVADSTEEATKRILGPLQPL